MSPIIIMSGDKADFGKSHGIGERGTGRSGVLFITLVPLKAAGEYACV